MLIAIIPRAMPWAMVCWAFSPFQPYRSKNFQYGLLSLENNKYNLYNKFTTLSISHEQNRARSSFAMARKGTIKWNLHASRVAILLQGKQQRTTLRLGHFLLIVLAKRLL
ncbi:MAG: hypothetical protein EGR49_06210 [Prevotella sp.]|nr:hypothetical protein [Prevotella sp.]